ncbi:hypothetical protein ABT174_11875 [Streptomyces sparsogenes]|uniref:hypothetical protein n=1 Tax=Streptomyces sparsogenes TaxID=67365 RepID=UPI0033221EC3
MARAVLRGPVVVADPGVSGAAGVLVALVVSAGPVGLVTVVASGVLAGPAFPAPVVSAVPVGLAAVVA